MCERCKVGMKMTVLDYEIPTVPRNGRWRVLNECPLCHLRVYSIVLEAKKK
jgi:hypothetical protein